MGLAAIKMRSAQPIQKVFFHARRAVKMLDFIMLFNGGLLCMVLPLLTPPHRSIAGGGDCQVQQPSSNHFLSATMRAT
ncbi:MAG: hypothetical protein ABL858_07195 [Candidatus Nitrotoga sp.]